MDHRTHRTRRILLLISVGALIAALGIAWARDAHASPSAAPDRQLIAFAGHEQAKEHR